MAPNGCVGVFVGGFFGGQQDPERGAGAGGGFERQHAVVLAQDAEHHRQAKTPPGELGGEEGLEDLAGAGLVDAGAVVADLDQDTLAGTLVAADDSAGEILFADRDDTCTHVNVPADPLGFFEASPALSTKLTTA